MFLIYLIQLALPLWGNAVPTETLLKLQSYKVKLEKCIFQTRPLISLREFKLENKKSRWIVDAQTLRTKILAYDDVEKCEPLDLESFTNQQKPRPEFFREYFKVLKKSNTFPGRIRGQGISNDFHHFKGTFLTIDLCPSKSNFDKAFFEKISEKHWPVAIAISGLWILKHSEDWQWLRAQMTNTDVLWINHSRNHPVYPDLPPEQNYLLSEGRDIQKEIIENEKLLIQRGITPSIFFRFPGLVANEGALKITLKLGLITLGSNAWLGKGQRPKPGSIILLHGNGNDPKGMKLFEKYEKRNNFSLPFYGLLEIFNLSKKQH